MVIALRDSRNGLQKQLMSQGFIVYFKGEIEIMAYVKRKMQLNTGDRIAHLLMFPYTKGKANPVKRSGTFGSTEKCVRANS